MRRPRSTLFPYTTLFRSGGGAAGVGRPAAGPGVGVGGRARRAVAELRGDGGIAAGDGGPGGGSGGPGGRDGGGEDRKSTRLNSSHLGISYAVFCLKKKKE